MIIKKLNSFGIFGLIATALISISFSPFQSDWQEAKKKDGIIIYTKKVTGYEIKMFKAITTYKNVKISKLYLDPNLILANSSMAKYKG